MTRRSGSGTCRARDCFAHSGPTGRASMRWRSPLVCDHEQVFISDLYLSSSRWSPPPPRPLHPAPHCHSACANQPCNGAGGLFLMAFGHLLPASFPRSEGVGAHGLSLRWREVVLCRDMGEHRIRYPYTVLEDIMFEVIRPEPFAVGLDAPA